MVDGKEEWISRSVVVVPFVVRKTINDNKLYMLVEKRGPAVSHTGEYCGPCGFLDYDENLTQACAREVREETGLEIDPDDFDFIDIMSDPKDSSTQNVSIRFINFESVYELPELDMNKIETNEEVDELCWVEIGRTFWGYPRFNDDNLGKYKWAFNHDKLVKYMVKSLMTDF